MSQKYYADIISTLTNSFETLDEQKFTQLLNTCERVIRNDGKIVVSGLGKNVPICEKFVGMMNSLGLGSAFLNTNSAMHGDLGVVKENDIVLILTKSGSTAESILLADYIKEWNNEKWLVSFNDGGVLGKRMENKLLLSLEEEGDSWDIIPNNSSACYLILLQGLALYLAERLDVKLEDFKRNHPGGAIGEQLLGDNYE